ncbi:lysophospholipid acyltransferase family protein [Solirhodobacter olei]|uniref:lysophospholipid acyltransferase family protein n=1 Tax=Solirhodobacter olei TaxID=2493082 RepID=UPI000FDC0AD6|nr:lysophospholipid acyltransferase family protein [Solirhodobacter olei]
MRRADDPRYSRAFWLQDRLYRLLLGILLRLPYRWRVPLSGWVLAHVVAPLAGYDKRVRDNLALIVPDLDEVEVARLARKVPDNVGRTLIELYSGKGFVEHVTRQPLSGPGLAALDAAHRAGRPVILVTGHFGNYDASRAALIARGYRVGGLYRPMDNGWFNDHYVKAISQIGTPLFPRGKRGLADMIRFLRSGGMLGMVIDQHMSDGARLSFLGRDALTSLAAAELALKYNALVIPTYGIRRPDGLDFDVVVESPIPNGSPEEMTQALNDSLGKLVREHMDQWFWIHRRWKGTA